MRLRYLVIGLLLALSASLPISAYAQGAGSIFSPIIPQECKCASVAVEGSPGQTSPSAASWGCILKVVQNVVNTLVGVAIVVIILAIVYAGFVFMTSAANSQARMQGKQVVTNALVGLLVILAAWLFVDFVMKAVYNPSATFSGENLGPWNSILASHGNDLCLVAREPTPIATGVLDLIHNIASSYPSVQIGRAGALCADGNPACSVQALTAQGLTDAQAHAMSCIAVTESSGNPNTPNSPTGACGTFQITTRPGNWSNPAYHGAGCSVSTSCNNASCNLQTAVIMFRRQGYQPWTGRKPDGTYWNPNAVACVARYDPGH